MADGAKNLEEFSYQPNPALTHVTPVPLPFCTPFTELAYLRLWLPNSLLDDIWLRSTNANLKILRRTGAKSTAARRHAATLTELWEFLAHYCFDHLNLQRGYPECHARFAAALEGTMGITRREKLGKAMDFSDETLVEIYDFFNQYTPTKALRGSAATIDETILAYYGADAKTAGVWRCIPEKPHQKGLLQYRAVATLKLSQRCVILAIEALFSMRRSTPTQAALLLLQQLQNSSKDALHVFLDSGFATDEMFRNLATKEIEYTICLKPPFTGPLGALHNAAVHELGPSRTRTYEYNGHIVQATCHGSDLDHPSSYITCVVSTGYTSHSLHSVKLVRSGTYESAVNDYKHCTAEELSRKYPHHSRLEPEELIRRATGWDVLAPPPNEQKKQVWTADGVRAMKKFQLTRICRSLAPHHGAPPSSKKEMVPWVIAHHIELQRNQSRPELQHATVANLRNLYSDLGLHTTDSAPVIANYSTHKGAVDRSNKDIYQYFRLSGHRTYQRALVFAALHALMLNAWSCYEEARLKHASEENRALSLLELRALKRPFHMFITNAMCQLLAEIK